MPSQCGGLTAGLGGATGLTGEHLHSPRYPRRPFLACLVGWLHVSLVGIPFGRAHEAALRAGALALATTPTVPSP